MHGDLDRYRQRRNRDKTPEPIPDNGGAADSGNGIRQRGPGGQRFVVQEHRARRLHWDFRLERDGVLVSWAVPKGVPAEPGPQRLAVQTEDHPLEYATFSGDIPRGEYGAGHVDIWDEGSYRTHKWDDRHIEVSLRGRRLEGRYLLIRTDESLWLLRCLSLSAPEMAEPLPDLLAPMMAVSGELPVDHPEAESLWAYEFKWDGVRALVSVADRQVRSWGRNVTEMAGRYPELQHFADVVGARRLLVDGELVAFDSAGRPSFGALQQRMHLRDRSQIARMASEVPVTYLIFDLLHLDGRSLLDEGYRQRRALLESAISAGAAWLVPPSFAGDPDQGVAVQQASRDQGLEGVIAKRLDSRYLPGKRSPNWVKVPNIATQEVVIGGWREGAGRLRGQLGAMLLGVPDRATSRGRSSRQPKRHGLTYIGDVGTGFSETERGDLTRLLRSAERAASPFTTSVPPDRARGAHWVSPIVVGEVQFRAWTADGRLRHASWRGLRSDKGPAQVYRDTQEPEGQLADAVEAQVDGRRLRLSNLGKELYPEAGLTKGEVIDYYRQVAPVLLPHLSDRVLTMFRCPDGIDGKGFFDKNARRHAPEWVRTVTVSMSEQTESDPPGYAVLDDVAGMIWAANLPAIEHHVPQWKVGPRGGRRPPDLLVFDLDPGAPAGIVECGEVAVLLRDRLAADGLDSYVKTSGSKGLQVYSPVSTTRSEQTSDYARALARELTSSRPEAVIDTMTRSLRAGKVLVDWSQNNPAKTTVAPYSLRARAGAGVSTPVSWQEVEGCRHERDLRFDYRDALDRVADLGDLFAPLQSSGRKLPGSKP